MISKRGHVDVLDIIVNLIFHLQNRHYFPLCAVVVRLLFATALQSNRIINLRMSRDHQKLNSILLSTLIFSLFSQNLNNTTERNIQGAIIMNIVTIKLNGNSCFSSHYFPRKMALKTYSGNNRKFNKQIPRNT